MVRPSTVRGFEDTTTCSVWPLDPYVGSEYVLSASDICQLYLSVGSVKAPILVVFILRVAVSGIYRESRIAVIG